MVTFLRTGLLQQARQALTETECHLVNRAARQPATVSSPARAGVASSAAQLAARRAIERQIDPWSLRNCELPDGPAPTIQQLARSAQRRALDSMMTRTLKVRIPERSI